MHNQSEVPCVITDDATLSPEQKLWLISLSGHLSMQNGYSLNTLKHHNKNYTDESVANGNLSILDNAYGVTTKEELIETLNVFYNTSNSQVFMSCMAELTRNDLLARYYIENKSTAYQNTPIGIMSDWAGIHKFSLARCGIRAFDIGRYAFLCRCGVSVNFLTEEEAWHYLKPIGKLAQTLFISWQEYATSYVVGRCIWQKITTQETYSEPNPDFNFSHDLFEKINDTAATLQSILADDEHPWCQLDWEMYF